MFKKGNIPSNRAKIGDERVDKNGYIEIKAYNGNLNKNWVKKHRYLYEKAHGKIKDGYKVIFADGNCRNFELDNLILVSDSELLIINQNGLYKRDKELTKTGSLIAKVIDKTNKKRKEKKNEKRN